MINWKNQLDLSPFPLGSLHFGFELFGHQDVHVDEWVSNPFLLMYHSHKLLEYHIESFFSTAKAHILDIFWVEKCGKYGQSVGSFWQFWPVFKNSLCPIRLFLGSFMKLSESIVKLQNILTENLLDGSLFCEQKLPSLINANDPGNSTFVSYFDSLHQGQLLFKKIVTLWYLFVSFFFFFPYIFIFRVCLLQLFIQLLHAILKIALCWFKGLNQDLLNPINKFLNMLRLILI